MAAFYSLSHCISEPARKPALSINEIGRNDIPANHLILFYIYRLNSDNLNYTISDADRANGSM